MTHAQLTTIRESITCDMLYEVIDGVVVEKVTSARESMLISLLMCMAGYYGLSNNLGLALMEMLFCISESKQLHLRPDLAFVSFQKWPRNRKLPNSESWDVVPNLVVECVKPTSVEVQLQHKISEYFAAGVERVWVVYPTEKQVYIYRSPTDNDILTEADELDGEHMIPGFRFPLKGWF